MRDKTTDREMNRNREEEYENISWETKHFGGK